MFHSLIHLAAHPYPVGSGQQEQGNKEPQDYPQGLHGPRIRLQSPPLALFQWFLQILLFWKVVATPFVVHSPVFQQQQSRIGTDYGLQRDAVHYPKWVISPLQILPPPDGLIARCRQAIKGIAMHLAIIINLIDAVDIAVISLFQIRGNQKKRIITVRKDGICHILSVRPCHHRKVVHRRNIALFNQHRLAVHKVPSCVLGITVHGKLFLHTIFLQNKSRDELRPLFTFGDLHAFREIHPYMIRTKIEHRKIIKAVARQDQTEDNRIQGNRPLIALGDKTRHHTGITEHHYGHQQ